MFTKIRVLKTIVLIFALCAALIVRATEPPRCYYQLKVYHFKTKAQEDRLDQYFKNAYKPALKRAGTWEVGVFKTLDQDTADRRFYVLITFSQKSKMDNIDGLLLKDKKYIKDAKDYLDAPFNDAAYTRTETIILRAFPRAKIPGIPKLAASKPDRIYELRSYESPTDALHVNKVKMFNEGGETVLFGRLNFNAVFYADVLVGSHMPNLMYMTAFENKADRDKHWETFSHDSEWETLVAKPEYAHNVSKADIIFLHPTEYSDF